MPKLPSFGAKNRIRTDVRQAPTVDPRTAGAEARAEADTFGAIAGITAQLAHKRAAADKNHTIGEFDNGLKDLKGRVDKELSENFNQNKPDYKGYADERNKIFKEHIDDMVSEQGNPFIAEELRAKGDSFLARDGLTSSGFEKTQTSKFYKSSFLNNRKDSLVGFRDGADLDSAYAGFKEGNLALENNEGNILSTPEKNALRAQSYQMATAAVEGMVDQKNYKEALDFLDGKNPEYADMRKEIPVAKLQSLKNKILRKQTSGTGKARSNYLDKVRNIGIAGKAGALDLSDPKTMSDLNQAMAEASILTDPKERAKAQTTIGSAIIESNMKSELMDMSEDQIDAKGKQLDSFAQSLESDFPFMVKAERAQLKNKYEGFVAKHKESMLNDGAKYMTENDKEIRLLSELSFTGDDPKDGPARPLNENYKEYKQALDHSYDINNVPLSNRTYMSKEMRSFYDKGVKNAVAKQDVHGAVALLNRFEDMAGEDTYAMMQEVKMNPDYAIVGNVDKDDRITAMNAIMNIEDSNTEFKRKNSKTTAEINTIKNQIEADPRFAAFAEMGGLESSRRNADSISSLVFKRYKEALPTSKGDEAAIEEAWSMFDGQNVVSDKNTSLLIPKTADFATISRLAKATTGDADDSRLIPTDSLKLKVNEDFSGSIEGLNETIKVSGKWRTSADSKNMELWARNSKGSMAKVKSYSFDEAEELGKDVPDEIKWWERPGRLIKEGAERVRTETANKQNYISRLKGDK